MITCSIEDKKYFDALVEYYEGDTKAAYQALAANDFIIPQEIIDKVKSVKVSEDVLKEPQEGELVGKKIKLVEKAIDILDVELKKLKKEVQVKKNEGTLKLSKALEKALLLMENKKTLESEAALYRFVEVAIVLIRNGHKFISTYNTDIDINNLSEEEENKMAYFLEKYREYEFIFKILDEINPEIFENTTTKDLYEELIVREIGSMEILKGKLKDMNKAYLEFSKKRIVKTLSKNYGGIQEHYKEKAEIQWNKEGKKLPKYSKLKGKELEEAKQEYIDNYLIFHSDQIKKETALHLENVVTETVDIDIATAWLVNPRNINHDLIGHAVLYLDQKENSKRLASLKKVREAQVIYDKFIKQVGKKSSQKEQYEMLYEKDEKGKVTTSIITKDSKEFPAFKKQYQGTAVWEMYEFITEIIKEKDSFVPPYRRLGNKLPAVNKNLWERLSSQGVWYVIKEGIKDIWVFRATDIEYADKIEEGEIGEQTREKIKENKNNVLTATTTSGKEKGEIPLFYRGKIEPNEQSFDLLSLMLLDYDNCLGFKTKLEASHYLLSIKEVMKEANVVQQQSFTKKIKINKNSKSERPVIEEGLKNAMLALESMIDHRIYGISLKTESQKFSKILRALRTHGSFTSMALNIHSGVTNFLQGHILTHIEATGRRTGKFTLKNTKRATAKLFNPVEMAAVIGDFGRRVPKSRTNLLRELFDISGKHNRSLNYLFSENNLAKRIADPALLMATQEVGEHSIESHLMYSFLDNIKIQNHEGKYINKKGEVVKNREEAMTLEEAIEFDEAGNYYINEFAFKTEYTNSLEEADLSKITFELRHLSRDLFGNYDPVNKAYFDRTALGYLVMHLRGWLVTGVLKRWRNVGTILDDYEDMDYRRKSYSLENNTIEEGTYTSLLRFITGLFRETKKLKIIAGTSNSWDKLTSRQKDNVTKASTEIAVAVLIFILFSLLDGGDDEDDEYLEAAYISRRLYSELITFGNPIEATRIARNPMMVLNTVNTSLELIWQMLTGPTEVYETGKRAGELKAIKKIEDLIPIINVMNSDTEDKLNFLKR